MLRKKVTSWPGWKAAKIRIFVLNFYGIIMLAVYMMRFSTLNVSCKQSMVGRKHTIWLSYQLSDHLCSLFLPVKRSEWGWVRKNGCRFLEQVCPPASSVTPAKQCNCNIYIIMMLTYIWEHRVGVILCRLAVISLESAWKISLIYIFDIYP